MRLAKLFRMSADFWLGLQTSWDLWHAIRAPEAEDITEIESVNGDLAE